MSYFDLVASYLPKNEAELYGWLVGLSLLHIVLSFGIKSFAGKSPFGDDTHDNAMTLALNGGLFSTSLVLLVGLPFPHILTLLGDSKPFLLTAGLAGIIYGVRTLFY